MLLHINVNRGARSNQRMKGGKGRRRMEGLGPGEVRWREEEGGKKKREEREERREGEKERRRKEGRTEKGRLRGRN